MDDFMSYPCTHGSKTTLSVTIMPGRCEWLFWVGQEIFVNIADIWKAKKYYIKNKTIPDKHMEWKKRVSF